MTENSGRSITRILLAGSLVLLSACSSGLPNGGSGATGPPRPKSGGGSAGTSAGSCVERFSERTLRGRSWAFDGTVLRIVPPSAGHASSSRVVFSVNRWYKGGGGRTFTVQTDAVPGAVTSAGGPDLSVGARILASGEGRYLWACGFSMPYSDDAARTYSRAFRASG